MLFPQYHSVTVSKKDRRIVVCVTLLTTLVLINANMAKAGSKMLSDNKNNDADPSHVSLSESDIKLSKKKGMSVFDSEGYVVDDSQEKPDPKQIGGIDLNEEAKQLAIKLRQLANKEIGVTEMQGIYDSLPYAEVQVNFTEKLDKVVDDIELKLTKYLKLLHTNKYTVEHLYEYHLNHPITHRYDCCNVPNSDLSYNEQYKCAVTTETTCDLIPPSAPADAFNPGRNLTEGFQHNVHYMPSVKWQYFISSERIFNEFPAHNYPLLTYSECKNKHETRHRDLFLSTIHPQRKNVVIVIDQGRGMSASQLSTAKQVAKHVLESLQQTDKASLFALSSEVNFPRVDRCLPKKLAAVTFETKLYFSSFIDKLQRKKTHTNHSLGFQAAFELILNTIGPQKGVPVAEDALIVYISRGLLSSLTDSKEVLVTISEGNARVQNRVAINTYAVVYDTRPFMYEIERTFLQDVAHQNFQKHHISQRYPGSIKRGVMTVINSTQDLSNAMGNFYKAFEWDVDYNPHVSLQSHDEIGQGLLISLSWPCKYEGRLLGVTGLDVPLGDVVEASTYYDLEKTTYSFVIDSTGYTVQHPSLQRPIVATVQPMHTDIRHFENYPGFENIREKMMLLESGEELLDVVSLPDNNTYPNHYQMQYTIRYLWKKVKVQKLTDNPPLELNLAPYIVVLKVIENHFRVRDLDSLHAPGPSNLVYHRLDLLPTDNTCMHLKQLATLDSSALFLSGRSFDHPFDHLSQMETKRMVVNYLAYLHDNTQLIPSFIKKEIRKDVAAISKINQVWMKRYRSTELRDSIVRRFAATPSGVFKVFPGTLIHKLYDPTQRDWFKRAVDYPGKVTLTVPYLDAGGAGYIVTVSHTIYEGKSRSLHAPFDRVVAVMGTDLTLGYFYKLLLEQMPICNKDHIWCFIMDDRGYLIAHRDLIESNGRGPVEQQHITHKEPLVANDILNHKGFVRKNLCNKYDDRTIQRFYQFNTSLQGELTNLVHGDHCAKYQVSQIPGTNTFLGVVNKTCDQVRAFCPCSTVDRLCLNCHRMEQTECECPCECPLQMDLCSGTLLQSEDSNPSCDAAPEKVNLVKISSEVAKALPQCYLPRCADRTTRLDCLGVVDCEWCYYDSDGTSPLKQPFCSNQRVCFAGVLGAPTPYADEIHNNIQGPELSYRTTPVGPVAGGIMGCFLLLALGVYCYRHHMHRPHHQYITASPDNNVHMARLEQEPEDLDSPDDPSRGHTNRIVLATFDTPAAVSPYRMNANYRRPTNAESDLGYSTMTPQDDSEQASTCIEPLIIGRDRYRPPPGASKPSSVTGGTPIIPPPPSSRRSRSPTPPQTKLPSIRNQHAPIPEQTTPGQDLPPGQTVLSTGHPNEMLASVQVHMVDTH